MSLRPLPGARFIRRTELRPGEYRKNFHQIDREVLSAVTSEEADRVTPLMSKIYLRMVNAPEKYWERDGVLRIEAEVRDEGLVKAWSVLCELVGVASATASKALRWMHEQGIIGYFSGKKAWGCGYSSTGRPLPSASGRGKRAKKFWPSPLLRPV